MKLRPKWNTYDSNQVDPYGNDFYWDDNYIGSFLYGRNSEGHLVENQMEAVRPGYKYVDVIESDGKRYRYTASSRLLKLK
jgi:hypothetical protein